MISAIDQLTPQSSCPSALHRALEHARQRAQQHSQPQLISMAFDISVVDPLLIFSQINQSQTLSFYWEKSDRQRAMVAMDSAIQITVTGPDRFQQARDWVQYHSDRLIPPQSSDDLAQPRFLCSFPFLDSPRDVSSTWGATLFLPRWQISTAYGDRPRTVAILNCIIDPHDDLDELWQHYQPQLDQIQAWGNTAVDLSRDRPLPIVSPSPLQPWQHSDLGDGQAFVDGVKRAIADIQNGHLRKVVLSHILDLKLSPPTHPATLLHNLRQRYPNCYTFAFGTGTGQTFLGASPECLVNIQRYPSQSHQRHLYTEALAGSAPRGTNLVDDKQLGDRLLSNKKECHEHRLVAEFIIERLQQLGIQTNAIAPPQLRKLANIQHLHAPIAGPFPSHLSPLDAVAALHPTPAVAGTPRPEAIARIAQYESFDRGFYAGPIGWVDGQGLGEFAVGIRSALFSDDQARLYAGAGIVAGSDPHRELAEVRLKLQALLAALV